MRYLTGINWVGFVHPDGDMSDTPPPTNGRTVLDSTTIDRSEQWWTGLVRDRDPDTGEVRVRLERATLDATDGWTLVHRWRLRPEYWADERTAVERFQAGGGRTDVPATPVDSRFDVTRYLKIRKDDQRWVAVVELDRPYKSPCTRLYHWELPDEARRQSWTIGRNWSKTVLLADRQLGTPA